MEAWLIIGLVIVVLAILVALPKSKKFRFLVAKRLSITKEPFIQENIQKRRSEIVEDIAWGENKVRQLEEATGRERENIRLKESDLDRLEVLKSPIKDSIAQSKSKIIDLEKMIKGQWDILAKQKRSLADYDSLLLTRPEIPGTGTQTTTAE